MRPSLVIAFALLGPDLLAPTPARGENWPQFRGPTGLGYTTEEGLPAEWGGKDQKNVVWKAPLVGQGHASPTVWNDRIFVTTAHWPDSVPNREKVIPEHHVICYSTADGGQIWDVTVPPGQWLRSDFRSGPGGGYAAPTPATDGKQIFVVFGSSVMAALDFEGKILWRKELEPHTYDVTIGSSPVIFGDIVIMLHAMAKKEDSKLAAYNNSDGSVKWETPLPKTGFGHSTPTLIDVKGKPQLIVVASGGGETDEGVQSFDPATGTRIWWCRGSGDASSAAYGAGIVVCDSGRGGPAIAIDPTGEGNVTDSHIRWRVNQVPEAIGSPIIVGELVYRLHTPNVLKCWKVSDGSEVYAKRLDGLGTTWASPIADEAGRIFFASAGKSYVIAAGEEFKVLATNDLGDSNHASPAVSNGRIYLLGTQNLYCVGAK
jgi:outer membrane protein assembly factor BamB